MCVCICVCVCVFVCLCVCVFVCLCVCVCTWLYFQVVSDMAHMQAATAPSSQPPPEATPQVSARIPAAADPNEAERSDLECVVFNV